VQWEREKPLIRGFRDRERDAIDHGDKLALDELQLFRKDVGTFIRQYDFLSQIVKYEGPSLEKLSIYLRHLAPVIANEQLNHEIDLSTVDFDFLIRKTPRNTQKLKAVAKALDAVVFRPFYPSSGMVRLSRDDDGLQLERLPEFRGLVRKVGFPRMVVPLAVAVVGTFNLLLNLVVLAIFLALNGEVEQPSRARQVTLRPEQRHRAVARERLRPGRNDQRQRSSRWTGNLRR